jgi:hypothetical protein
MKFKIVNYYRHRHNHLHQRLHQHSLCLHPVKEIHDTGENQQ